MPSIDWKDFEDTVAHSVMHVIGTLMAEHQASFYAVVFHEFYAESGGTLAMPCLAANTVEHLAGREESRWSSADWKWTEIKYETAETKKLHRIIERLATSDDEQFWELTHAKFIDAFVNIANRLTAQLEKHPCAAKEFGVFVFSQDDESKVLQRCMTPAKFKKLFPQLHAEQEAAKSLQSSPLDSKLQTYSKDVHSYHSEIVNLGALALPMLCQSLQDRAQSWAAADCVKEIGIADPDIVQALKQNAKQGNKVAFHETMALASLGEIDFVLELADSARTRAIAVQGICGLYFSREPVLLDYRPLERLLEKPGCQSLAEENLNGHCEITDVSIDEALRGLESKYPAIRQHSTSALGRRFRGKAADRILPALAARLQDSNATVRRLAIVSLSGWKKTAKPHADEIRKLFADPDPKVATFAKDFIKYVE